MKAIRNAVLALALCSAGVHAEDRLAALQASLAADGLTPISEGLYGHREGGNESYVAYTPAGQQALLQRLLEWRAAHSGSAKAANAKPNALDEVIERLSQASHSGALASTDYRDGNCNGIAVGGPFRVITSANGGLSASASVQNTSSPTINTTNEARASAIDTGYQETLDEKVTHGNTPVTASAAVSNPRLACSSSAVATITCPGATQFALISISLSNANPGEPIMC